MIRNDASAMLKDKIIFLERKVQLESEILHAELKVTLENLKPVNIIKNTFQEAMHSPDMKHNAVNAVIGLITGYFTEKIVSGSTRNPVKKVFGILLEAVVANAVAKNFDTIKDTGTSLFKRLFKRNHKKDTYEYN